jgi:hypothetical protein
MERQHRWRRLLLGLVIVLALIAGALVVAVAAGFILHDTAKPVSIEDVVRRFHELRQNPGKFDGVYVYATRGGESVDVLGGAHHRYPPKTSITVVHVPCGVRLRWEALEERSATWTFCATELGIELRAWEVAHRFFGRSDSTSYECPGTVLVPANRSAGATSPFRCRSSRAHETGQARVVGIQKIAVAGTRLNAVHVRTVAHVKGGDNGTEITDWWLDERRALPVRIGLMNRTSRPYFLGDVHYEEDAELRLVSTVPLR